GGGGSAEGYRTRPEVFSGLERPWPITWQEARAVGRSGAGSSESDRARPEVCLASSSARHRSGRHARAIGRGGGGARQGSGKRSTPRRHLGLAWNFSRMAGGQTHGGGSCSPKVREA